MGIGEETAWQDSGGGFSNYFNIPEYQKSFVAAYKASPDADLPPQDLWNNSGRGYPAMGFLNPFIYQNPQAFQDVTSGVNTGSPTRKYGFKAIKGWDAATGLGTPDFEALSKAAMATDVDTIVV